jgi:hypothetical protein
MDVSAVAVCKENDIVGHVPFNISSLISQFLRRDCNKGFAEVTGPRVNRGAGYGLEIPCVFKLYGPKPYTGYCKISARKRTALTVLYCS